MRHFSTRKLILAGTAIAAGAGIVGAQVATAPVARYEMRAGTTSGFGAGMAGGGGVGSALGMAFGGGGNKAQHELWLDLGSSRAPTGGPAKADHFMPAGAKLGASVALRTPVQGKPGPVEKLGERDFQRPKGRMLIFWGCGEHVGPGQPVVIDFAKIAAGQMPPGLWSTNVPMERYVSPANSRTYGHWPADDGKSVKPESSLIGAHRVAGNYSPDIAFTLTHDFMGALRASSAPQASGSVLMRWNGLPGATGYHASLIGGKQGPGGQMADIVWWSSSATREFGGGLADWLSPATVARLVANRTVLSPQTTMCTVPVEVKRAAPDFMMTSLYAYGPEEAFSYPPKPANSKAPWHLEWSARIRHRSMTGFLMGVPGMESMGQSEQEMQRQTPCPPKKKRGLGGFGGLIGGALGVPTGGNDDGC